MTWIIQGWFIPWIIFPKLILFFTLIQSIPRIGFSNVSMKVTSFLARICMNNAVTQHIPFDMSNVVTHSFVYKNPLLAWTDCQSSFTCHTLWTIHNAIFCSYATQKHLDSKTILGKHIIWYYNTYFNDFSKPNYLIATYHIVLKIIQLCQNKDLFYNQPSSFFILGFIKWSQKSGIYCHPKISMPRVSNLPWTLFYLW